MSMSVLSFFCHLFICLLGVLLSISFGLLLIHIFPSTTPNEHLHHVTSLLFSSKETRPDILTIPSNDKSSHSVWLFGLLVTDRLDRAKLQSMYVKLYHHYLFVHFTAKRRKNVHHLQRRPILFTDVLIFDISQSRVALKLVEQIRTQYWSNKAPIVLRDLRFLARYQINKKKKHQHPENPIKNRPFQWYTMKPVNNRKGNHSSFKDEIHFYTLTMRSKEEWFYRLHNCTKLHSKSVSISDEHRHQTVPIDQLETEYNLKKELTRFSSFDPNQLSQMSPNPTWPLLLKTFFEHIHLFPSKSDLQPVEKSTADYLCILNHLISRCTLNLYQNLHLRNYLQSKIQRELKHLKLPSYIEWIRMTRFHCDNVNPKLANLGQTWFNHNGLWSAVEFLYQGNLSMEFQIKINFVREKENITQARKYSFFPRHFKRLNHIQLFQHIIKTVSIITINIRSLKGILLVNIPFPPSDRLWFGLEEMPLIDFDVHHRQSSENQINTPTYSKKDFNQLQTAIDHLLSQWIKKQIRKECVLPNMHDICMQWSNDPLEKKDLLRLKDSSVNHLSWFERNDLNRNLPKNPDREVRSSDQIYLLARWKEKKTAPFPRKKILSRSNPKCRWPRRILLTEKFLLLKHN